MKTASRFVGWILAGILVVSTVALRNAVAAPTDPVPLRLHPKNPRLFEFRGKPTWLVTSGEHYGAVLNLDFDHDVYLNELAERRLNYTRIFTGAYVELPGAFGIEKNTLAPAPGRFIAPWARGDQPGYRNGGAKFDLDRWDEAYFRRLKGFVGKAAARGIVVEVTLFSSLYGKPGWEASPLFEKNNVNGVGTVDRKKVHTLDNGNLLERQEAMVRKIVKELADADNVFFEIQNEPWADLGEWDGITTPASAPSLAWQRRIAAVITEAERGRAHRHLIAQNVSNRSLAIASPDRLVSIFNFHYTRPPAAMALNPAVRGAFGFDETGFDGGDDKTYRQQAWHFLMAGGALFNNLDYSFTVEREDGTDTQKAPGGGSRSLREQLGTLSAFMHGFGDDLLTATPGEGFVKQGAPSELRALSAPGRAYALYFTGERLGTLGLDVPMGAYTLEWFDPAAGRPAGSDRTLHAGGLLNVKPPAGLSEVALRIRRAPEELRAEDLPAKAVTRVMSPGAEVEIATTIADLGTTPGYAPGPRLYFQVAAGKGDARKVVVPWSPMGITRGDESFVAGLVPVTTRTRSLRERYRQVRGKALELVASANEKTLVLKNPQGSLIEVDLRAYDDGVAFRYRLPGKTPGFFQVTHEETGFRIGTGTEAPARGFLTPHDRPTQWTPAYEALWQADVRLGTPSPAGAGWSFPALFNVGDRWLLVTESGLDGSFFGARLEADAQATNVYRIRMPDYIEGEGLGEVVPEAELPWTLPWRVIAISQGLGGIVESNLVTHLAPPSRIKDTRWIKPGRVSWSWWSESDSPKSYQRLAAFVDFAAEMGWEYSLVDANWQAMKGGDWKQLVAHARTKNVRVLLWYNSGGANNKVTEAPRDLMFDRSKRRAEMKAIAAAGIAGIKVDFFHSDKQATIQQYLGILEDAAEFKLLVNFHGCTIPRGWSRTWPNLMGHEAVRGAEVYKFNKVFPAAAPAHNTILPFTRNVIGPMDYTPVTFSDSENPHVTTFGHELALSVLFEVGLQHFADSVDAYRKLPEAPLAFLKEVPVVWEETRLVAGEPGRLAVLARRSGKTWYVAGINGEPAAKTVEFALAFAGKAGSWNALVIADGDSDRTFKTTTSTHAPADKITVAVRGHGGFVVKLAPAR
jgi:hypothetical protein